MATNERSIWVEFARLDERITAADKSVSTALAAKSELDAERNQILNALRTALSECVRLAEYNRRHDELLKAIAVERDFRNRILGIGGVIAIVWPIVIHFLWK